jgi:hypothetical protein
MKYVCSDLRCRLNCILQLVELGVEDNIGLPLLVHVVGLPQHTKLCGQCFERFDLRKSGSLWQFPSDESDEYEKPTKVELIPLVLRSFSI